MEGILDAQFIETIQAARGVSTAAAGSCIIDAGGCEEVNHYLNLCIAFGKRAFFLYDLDSLFNGNLRACVRPDGSVQSFLAALGVGNNFGTYCGQLDSQLTILIDKFLALAEIPAALQRLKDYLLEFGVREDWSTSQFAKARVATLSAVSLHRAAFVHVMTAVDIENIEGRLKQICAALKHCNVFLLPRGALELYMPSYTGDFYKIPAEAKNPALKAEIEVLAGGLTSDDMANRYSDLYKLICELPSKPSVDVEPVLKEYLGSYIHDLQASILDNPTWELQELKTSMLVRQSATGKIFGINSFLRGPGEKFTAVIGVLSILGQGARVVKVTEITNAGMRHFTIEQPLVMGA